MRTRKNTTGAPQTQRIVLDVSDLGPMHTLPLVSEPILRAHNVAIASDNRFRSAARLLQALWREDRELPIGINMASELIHCELGSLISTEAGATGANFLHPAIAHLVKRELIYREVGAVYDELRLLTNLLSSQPLVFNLFGPLKLDLAHAAKVVNVIVPGYLQTVTDILFEHSPGRGDQRFTADGTAFDLLIKGEGPEGQRRFIAIEVKYSEDGHEPVPRFSGRFDAIAPECDLFVDPMDDALRANPVQQLFRQMCLAHTMIGNDLYDEGFHLFLAPAHNRPAHMSADYFVKHLRSPDAGKLRFMATTLEAWVQAIADVGGVAHAKAFHRRYCDWWLIDGELNLAAPIGCDDDGFVFRSEQFDEAVEPENSDAAASASAYPSTTDIPPTLLLTQTA